MNQRPLFLREARTGHLIFWAGFLMFAGAGLFGLTLHIGKSIGRQEAAQEFALRPVPTRPAPAAALTQWTCQAQEMREYVHACKGRIRLGKVGG